MIDRGLDLSKLDTMSESEATAFRESYTASHGGTLDVYQFWLEFAPRVAKSHRLQIFHSMSDDGRAFPAVGTFGFLHLYAAMGYATGVGYEIEHLTTLGASRAQIIQTIELAFIDYGPRVADVAWQFADTLRGGHDVSSAAFPAHWGAADSNLPAISVDPLTSALSDEESGAIERWCLRYLGEVPASYRLLMRLSPGLLKAYVDRLSRAMTGPLPPQAVPFARLQTAIALGRREQVRENVLLGRALGLTLADVTEAMSWGSMYCGPTAGAALLDETVGDLLSSW